MPQFQFQFYQIAILLISSIMIFLGLEKFLKRQQGQSFMKLMVRIIVWGGMAIIALFPRISNQLASFMGIEGNINAVILTGFL